MITLVSELAIAMGENQALKVQTENANEAAKRYLEENEGLRKVTQGWDKNKVLQMLKFCDIKTVMQIISTWRDT